MQADYILICFDAVRFLSSRIAFWTLEKIVKKKCKFEKMELLLGMYLSSDL